MTGAPRKIWDIPGGIHPLENKRQSLQLDIGTVPLPPQLIIPLNQHSGAPAKPVVAVGDRVLKGQLIAEAAGRISAPIHASSSGIVSTIDQQPIAHPSGMTATCITIDTDGEERWIEHAPISDYRNTPKEQLLTTIRHSGIAGLGGAGFPAAVKLDAGQPIHTLIINATECEPYITADDMLTRSRPVEIIEGIQILSHLLGNPEQVLIGIEDNKAQAYDALAPHLKGTNIELVEFPTKYPSGGEKQLIQILTGQELPNGQLPADIGIICQNIGTVYAIYRAVVLGEPLISRITTVTGEACKINRNLEVLIGTPIDYLLALCEFDADGSERVIMGGPMMGFALHQLNVPVVKTTNCILAPSRKELPAPLPAQPCIRCGACAEVCPASLLPQQLLWYAQAGDTERLQSHNLFDCIECGACAYVCPSHIPLVQYYRAAKGTMRQQALEKIKADRARERFEFNKQRKAQQEAERAAKREARRLATEQAKNRMAESTPEKGATEQAGSDVVQAAMARIAATQATPEKQRAKLARGVESSRSRLERLEQKLAAGDELTEEQRTAMQAQIESARIKLADAEQKLKAFDNGDSAPEKTSNQTPEAKAVAKVLASPRQTLEAKVAALDERIANLQQKIADTDDDSLKQALQNSLNKFIGKRTDAVNELQALPADGDQPVTDSATIAATERAVATTVARQQQSDGAQQQAAIDRLKARIAKAEQQLANTDNQAAADALRGTIERLQQKLRDTENANTDQ